jgi:hypothetical protein
MHQIKIQRRFASNLYIVSSVHIGLTVIAGKCNANWDIVVIEYYIQKQTLFVVLYLGCNAATLYLHTKGRFFNLCCVRGCIAATKR